MQYGLGGTQPMQQTVRSTALSAKRLVHFWWDAKKTEPYTLSPLPSSRRISLPWLFL